MSSVKLRRRLVQAALKVAENQRRVGEQRRHKGERHNGTVDVHQIDIARQDIARQDYVRWHGVLPDGGA
jgi:hypothetical protein